MDKKALVLVALFVLIPFAFAAEEFVIPEGELSQSDMILQQTQQNILQLGALNEKIDELGVAQAQNLEQMAIYLNAQLADFRLTLLITIILTALSVLGLWWAIFLYFQSNGLITWPLKKK